MERPLWEKYVSDMSAFYLPLLGEYFNVVANYQYDFEIEDVTVLKNLSHLYKMRELEVVMKQTNPINMLKKNYQQHKTQKMEFTIDGIVTLTKFKDLITDASR